MPFLKTAANAPVIFSATFEVTKRCNLVCLHCYRVEEPDRQEMSLKEVKDAIDQLRSMGAFSIYFTGGEVFSRSDFLEIVAYTRAKRMNVTIASNAHFIDAGVARELKALGVMSVAISVYGSSGPTHDRMTQQIGSWDKTMTGSRHLLDQGTVTIFRFIMTHFNQHELEAMLAMAKEMGAYHRLMGNMTPRTDRSRDPLDLRVDREAFAKITKINIQGERLPALETPNPDQRAIKCGVSWNTCTLNPYGDVLPCLILPTVAGNLRQDSLSNIWKDSPVFTTLRNLRFSDFHSCSQCNYVSRCNRCLGMAYMENGSIFEPAANDHCERVKLRSDLYDELVKNEGICPAHAPEGSV